MRYLLLFMLFVGAFVLGNRSCRFINFGNGVVGEGDTRTENRTVSEFYGVSTTVPGRVEVSQSEQYSVQVSAYGNLLPLLKTEVEGGILNIYFNENIDNAGELLIRISTPNIEVLKVAGSGDLMANTVLKGEKLTLNVAGSGNLELPQMEYTTLRCNIAGSGEVTAGGTIQEAKADIAGSGNLNARALTTRVLDANIAGSGSVYMNVTETLEGSVVGSGNLYYGGHPDVKASVNGSGSIEKM